MVLTLKSKKKWLLFFLLSGISCNLFTSDSKTFHINLISEISKKDILTQKKLQDKRCLYRYAVTIGTAAAVCGILYGAAAIRQSFDQRKQQQMVAMPEHVQNYENNVSVDYGFWPINFCMSGCKKIGGLVTSVGYDMSKFLADSTTMLTAGVITSAVYDNMRQRIAQAYQDESVLWFFEQQTKLQSILADLKQQTVQYDLHSTLLSHEIFNQDANLHVKAFVHDVSDALQNYRSDRDVKNDGYFTYLLGQVQQKYMRQADEAEVLKNHMTPHLAQQARMNSNDEQIDLFSRDHASRQDIADLCCLLVDEMKNLLSFIDMHQHACAIRVQDLRKSGNDYLLYMEKMLHSSQQELDILSKKNRGMFTVTYEYEKLLMQQIMFLHKYCKVLA